MLVPIAKLSPLKNFALVVAIEYTSFGTGIFGRAGFGLSFSVAFGAKIVIMDLGIEFKRLLVLFRYLPASSFFTSISFKVNIDGSGCEKEPSLDVHFLPSHSAANESVSTLCVKEAVSVLLITSKTFLAFILYFPVGLKVFGFASP